ncbi:hypothetical protein M378DRAFT_163833 [Amanita muscaria Koide BX008]|uniref:Uncharacterized protein n=1 Tax=Amanita muscaria (strain Koide BX008) TaxID=946122 RepID=A0A0C2X3U2_AMAMK|nr:hypothetical protein M378DRAFT_163833 [Amanita muscaria Koide BX008]
MAYGFNLVPNTLAVAVANCKLKRQLAVMRKRVPSCCERDVNEATRAEPGVKTGLFCLICHQVLRRARDMRYEMRRCNLPLGGQHDRVTSACRKLITSKTRFSAPMGRPAG